MTVGVQTRAHIGFAPPQAAHRCSLSLVVVSLSLALKRFTVQGGAHSIGRRDHTFNSNSPA